MSAKKKSGSSRSGAQRSKQQQSKTTPDQASRISPSAERDAETSPPPSDGIAQDGETTSSEPGRKAGHVLERLPFPVVGFGASAGGIEAFVELLKHLSSNTGMAFVFLQHLDPRHRSNLSEILAHNTSLPVHSISDGMTLVPNHIYVVPAGSDLGLFHGVLHLIPRPETSERYLPIDRFFRSLAEDQGPNAIAVLLSGTGSDGTLGLRAVKAEGGITITQSPESAKYAGMPSSPAATDVDLVLPPDQIASELERIGQHPHLQRIRRRGGEAPELESNEELQKIFILLRRASGVDFSLYKQSTVGRRISRRMLLHKIESLKQYLRFLQQTPGEVNSLFEEMLINVTGFFRDPEVFEALKSTVFPKIFQDRGPEVPVRIWVPACSTGEEAYSIAISLIEYLGVDEMRRPIQIFATDVSDISVERARSGRYRENIASEVSPERLRRFFNKTDTGFHISKMIRDMCVVAKQNVVKDPPFSNLDLISCRNLLIYMGPTLQNRVIPTFHYALRPSGFLLLGSSETIGSHSDLFSLADKKHKIYAKKSTPARLPAHFGTPEFGPQPTVEQKAEPHRLVGVDLEREADRIVLEKYAPAGVVVDEHMNILQFRGQTGRYLEPAPGQASLSLLRLAKRGLVFDVRAAIHRAKREGQPVRKEGIRIGHNGGQLEVCIEVIPILGDENEEAHFLVIFEESAHRPADPVAAPSKSAKAGSSKSSKSDANKELEDALNDLAQTKETLRTIIEQHEATNEELRAANEEIQSSNEELQSTNEELETAKEELQSTNEELTTLNEELENRNAELSRIINDHNNLLASVDMPIIMFDVDRKIRLFTPMATTVFSLIPADQGRPIGALSLAGQIPGLEQKVEEAIDQLTTKDEEICLANGRWYTMRLRPYKTAENRIEGAVLALVDITDTKLAKERGLEEKTLRQSLAVAEAILATLEKPFVVLDPRMGIVSANRAFYDTFQVSPEEVKRRPLDELDRGAWNTLQFRQMLKEVIPHGTAFKDYLVEQDFPRVGHKKVRCSGQRLDLGPESLNLVLLTMEDVTDDPRPGAGEGDSASPR